MSSLHEMIFSQQSEAQNDDTETTAALSPPPRKQKRQKHKHAATTERTTAATSSASLATVPPSSSSTDDAVNRLYGTSFAATTAAPETIISNGIERRRKKRPGRPRSANHPQYGDDDDDLWETESEALVRIQRTNRKRQYKEIQARWKKRKRYIQQEVDYGNAVQHMARKVLVHTRKRRRKQQQDYQDDNDDRKQEAVSDSQKLQDITMMMHDSSDEEQQEALGSLWTSMKPQQDQDPSEHGEDENADSGGGSGTQIDPHDYSQWDYYQLGYDAPRNDDLQDFYYYNYARDLKGSSPFPVNLMARIKRRNDMEAVTYAPTRIDGKRKKREQERYYLNDVELPTTCLTHSSFHHASAVQSMALQYLVTNVSVGTTPDRDGSMQFENRLLRNLYSAPTQKVGRSYHVLTQAMERGCEFVLFHAHRWKQRPVAARALGMTVEFHRTGCPRHGIGYSLERLAIKDSEGPDFRKQIVQLLSDGTITYRPDTLQHIGESADDGVPAVVDSQENDSWKGESNEVNANSGNADDVEDERDKQSSARQAEGEMNFSHETARVDLESDEQLPDPDATSFRVYMGSDVSYIHKAGTCPPVPSFPLDESGVILGGEDRYARVHHTAKIDDATYTATLSILLARLGQARLDKDSRAIQDVQKQIMTYLDEATQEVVVLFDKFSFMRRKRQEVPSVMYYRSMMGLCSFVANSGCSFDDSEQTEDPVAFRQDDQDLMDVDNDSLFNDSNESVNMKAVAQTIYNHCAECPRSPSLTIFPRIHVTTALTLIAKSLPPSAADILARPLDELSHRTPFDIMRKALEFLEENGLLTETHAANLGGDGISAGYLEHIVHQATEIFRRAAAMDPDDFVCQAWYISGIASSLLLCSGNAINSKAYLLPSSKKATDDMDMMFSEASTRGHEVRQKMAKFSDLRIDLSDEIKKLIRRANDHASSRGKLVVSSFLEWSQVIALLIGNRTVAPDEDRVWSDIRRLHSRFAVEWAIRENSESAFLVVEEMIRQKHVSTNYLLELLASAVENNPNCINSWRRLVLTLGPIGAKVTSRQRKQCKKSNCQDCRRLRKGLNVDHVGGARQSSDTGWWGRGRASWWDEQIIALEGDSAETFTAKDIFRVCEIVEKRLKEQDPPMLFDAATRRTETAPYRMRVASNAFDEDIGWLNVSAVSNGDLEALPKAQKARVNHLLPSPFVDLSQQGRTNSKKSTSSLVFDTNVENPRLEIHCYKIVIACHLYGISHRIVGDLVWNLAQKCWNDGLNSESREWTCLLWLSSSMGLNIPRILHDLYTSRTTRMPARDNLRAYSVEEKEAVKYGREIFGPESWTKIRDFFAVFQNSSRSHVKNIYKSMKANGEL